MLLVLNSTFEYSNLGCKTKETIEHFGEKMCGEKKLVRVGAKGKCLNNLQLYMHENETLLL